MNAFGRRRGDDQIPRSLQNSARPDRLPELHIELSSGRSTADQTFHSDAFSHYSIMSSNMGRHAADS
jgi:hypothetical protein